MLRDIFTNRWILGSIALLIIIAGGCYFWYQHQLATYEKQAAEFVSCQAEVFPRQWEKNQKAKPKATTETEQAAEKAPVESDTPPAERKRTDTSPVAKDIETTQAQTRPSAGTSVENAETTDVRVSPFGFGPYPEVPEALGFSLDWDRLSSPEGELLMRVRIKLLNQGVAVEGAGFSENGRIYPIIRGTVYIGWSDNLQPNGKPYVARIRGHPLDDAAHDEIKTALDAGGTPPVGYTILEMDDAGRNPYKFLNLNKE